MEGKADIQNSFDGLKAFFRRYEKKYDRIRGTDDLPALKELSNELGTLLTSHLTKLDSHGTEEASLASHDLRSVQSQLTGYMDLMALGTRPEKAQKYDKWLKTAFNKAFEILDHCNQPFQAKEVNLKELVSEVCNSHDFSIVTDLAEIPESALIDPHHMKSLLNNLINNAKNNLTENKIATPRIEVGGTVKGEEIAIYISDNGTGIPKDVDVFRKHLTSREEVGGTGLGGYIVKRVAEMHGGEVSHKPRPGGGTKFTVKIPTHRKMP